MLIGISCFSSHFLSHVIAICLKVVQLETIDLLSLQRML